MWCSQPEAPCSKYLAGKITRKELNDLYSEDRYVCYENQMLGFWRTYAGITHNGVNKGKPMALRNVKANSLAFLTIKLPYSEEDRFIFAVFLIDEKYEGDNKDAGYVEANSKYKIELSLDEAKRLNFWNYYFNPNKPEKIIFGSGLHRYLTDNQAAQILKEICEINKGTLDEVFSKEFLEHYCRI